MSESSATGSGAGLTGAMFGVGILLTAGVVLGVVSVGGDADTIGAPPVGGPAAPGSPGEPGDSDSEEPDAAPQPSPQQTEADPRTWADEVCAEDGPALAGATQGFLFDRSTSTGELLATALAARDDALEPIADRLAIPSTSAASQALQSWQQGGSVDEVLAAITVLNAAYDDAGLPACAI